MPINVLKEDIDKLRNSLPTGVQDFLHTISVRVINICKSALRGFVSYESLLKQSFPKLNQQSPVYDLCIDEFIIHDFASYTDGDPREVREKYTMRVPFLTYNGNISFVEGEDSQIKLPFRVIYTLPLGDYLFDTKEKNIVSRIQFEDIGRTLLVDQARKYTGLEGYLVRAVVERIEKRYNYNNLILNHKYRRKEKRVQSLPSVAHIEKKHVEIKAALEGGEQLPQWRLYDGEGGKLYRELILGKNHEYAEQYIQKNKYLSEFLLKNEHLFKDKKYFIDVGSLDGEKVLEILEDLGTEKGTYIGIDATMENLVDLANRKSNRFGSGPLVDLNIVPVGLGFDQLDTLAPYSQKVIFDLGNTLGNETSEKRLEKMKAYSATMSKDDIIVLEVSLFSTDESMESSIQGDATKMFNEWIINAFHRLGCTDVDKDNVKILWNKNEKELQVLVNTQTDTPFQIGNHTGVILGKNSCLASRSKKFLVEEIMTLVEDSELKVICKSIQENQGIFILRKA